MLKRFLLIATLALFASVGVSASAQAATVTLTPQSSTPLYDGANGSGNWTSWVSYHTNAGNITYQVEALTYLYLGDTGQDFRNNVFSDAGSDVTFKSDASGDGTPQYSRFESNGNTSYGSFGCPYPGFHWFGYHTYYRSRTQNSLHQWQAWTAWQWTAVSAGVYAQVCL